jgi:micrococcal nuclease
MTLSRVPPMRVPLALLVVPLVLLAGLWPRRALPYTLTGKVVAVPDSSSIIVRDDRGVPHPIRLAWIAVPTASQHFAKEAKDILRHLVAGRSVLVEWDKREESCGTPAGRAAPCAKLGRVMIGDLDVNLEMLRRGAAWHDPRTVSDQSTTDRELYPHEQREAIKRRVGLWAEPNPVQPWEYREPAAEPTLTPVRPPTPIPTEVAAPKKKGKALTKKKKRGKVVPKRKKKRKRTLPPTGAGERSSSTSGG